MSITAETTTVPTGTWNADTVHSSVTFEVPYAVATFSGSVTDFDAALADGRLTGAARIGSITVKDENLEAHLLSPEFFDAERHPEVGFTTDTIRRNGDAVEVEGEITIKGITKPATLRGTIVGPSVDHFGKNRVGLSLETTVDRTDFDINWNMPLPNGEPALANEVTLKADLTLVGQDS
ncbi:MAG TPA: YceI family protein [Gaiellaceae bacterium]|nr:YceI family protein [Gaiellaceae bacterium]